VKNLDCYSMQEGGICSAELVEQNTTDVDEPNVTSDDTTSNRSFALEACYEPGISTFFCPRRAGSPLWPFSRNVRCQVCAVEGFVDMDEEVGKISGTVSWGQNMIGGEIDESMLDGYDVWLADSCGELRMHLGRVDKIQDWPSSKGACCEATSYSLTFGAVSMPEESMGLMIIPFQGTASLIAGVVIPISERTTTITGSSTATATTTTTATATTTSSGTNTSTATTSTKSSVTETMTSSTYTTLTRTSVTVTITTLTPTSTTTTVTHTSSSITITTLSTTTYIPFTAVLRGCLSLTLSDSAAFIRDAASTEVIKQAISDAAGADVLPSYVKDVIFKEGESCSSRRLEKSRLADPARRLSAAVSADYVLVIPSNRETDGLGGAEAIGKRVISRLQAVTPEEVTLLLVESMKNHMSLNGITASVTSVGALKMRVAVNPLVVLGASAEEDDDDQEQAADEEGNLIVTVACTALIVLAMLSCCMLMAWRQRKNERKESTPSFFGNSVYGGGGVLMQVYDRDSYQEDGRLASMWEVEMELPEPPASNQEETAERWPELENFKNEDVDEPLRSAGDTFPDCGADCGRSLQMPPCCGV